MLLCLEVWLSFCGSLRNEEWEVAVFPMCDKISAIYGTVNTIVRTVVGLGDPLVKPCPRALPYTKYRAYVIISLNPPKRKLMLRGGPCFLKVLSLESSRVNLWIQGQPSEQSPGNHVATRMDLILHSHLRGEFFWSDSGSQLLSAPGGGGR